jgi:hypothetical protein
VNQSLKTTVYQYVQFRYTSTWNWLGEAMLTTKPVTYKAIDEQGPSKPGLPDGLFSNQKSKFG